MRVYLEGIGAQFFQGIGPEPQFIGPFSEMNFFVGPNNAGKSIVLSLIDLKFNGAPTDGSKSRDYKYLGAKSGQHQICIGASANSVVAEITALRTQRPYNGRNIETVRKLLDVAAKNLCTEREMIWSDIEGELIKTNSVREEESRDWQSAREWQNLWLALQNHKGGGQRHWIGDTLQILRNAAHPALTNCQTIPAKRELGPTNQTFDDLTGKGLLDQLAAIQNPDYDKREDAQRFNRINQFLQTVTDKPDARLEVPSNRKHLLVHMDNKVLPLSSLGTGIHEVILIAAFCTIYDHQIMCIEEPEIHLHPILQRKLIAYLRDNTENQYFIATHSAAFIDTPDSSIFRVWNDGVQTYVESALTAQDKRDLLDDLGYRPSDILQANFVIWVEGPSDRIYLNHWIASKAEHLKEGIHYTIMFYGGALVSHLGADDSEAEDLINLKKMCRNAMILLDSDREEEGAALKPSAQRLQAELNEDEIWITEGREIENYVDPDVLHGALKKVHSSIYNAPAKTGPFDNAFHFMRNPEQEGGSRKRFTGANKVKTAHAVCETPPDFTRLNLGSKIDALIARIEQANTP